MNRDLHDIDELFISALKEYKEIPPAGVKQNIDAALAEQQEESGKKRMLLWKRSALLVLLLLPGYALFESLPVRRPEGKNDFLTKNSPARGADNTYEKRNSPEKNGSGAINKSIPQNTTSYSTVVLPPPDARFPSFSVKTKDYKEVDKGNQRWLNADHAPVTVADNPSGQHSNPYILAGPVSTGKVLKPLLPYDPVFGLFLAFAKEKIAGSKVAPVPTPQKKNLFSPYWLVTAFTSYEQVGYSLDSDDPDIINTIKHNEVREPSFSGGILATRQFSRRWGFQTGLIYYFTEIGINPQKIYAFQDPSGDIAFKYITSSGYAYIKPSFGPPPAFGDSVIAESKHTLKSINIPLSVKYRMGKNKLTVTPGAGIEAGFITNAKAEVELTDASNHETAFVNKLKGTKKFYLSAVADVEIQYRLNKKTAVTLQPVFRHALSPITENTIVETFPRSFGIRAGITLIF